MKQMRILHRYLGYFLVGIMSVYAFSGTIMTFRDTDFLKSEKKIEKKINPNIAADELGKALERKNLKVTKEENGILYFENGQYNSATGDASYTVKEWPKLVQKMTNLHKARSKEPLFFFNIFFAFSLFFFVVSSFWMFPPQAKVYKRGILFVIAGLALTVLLLFLK